MSVSIALIFLIALQKGCKFGDTMNTVNHCTLICRINGTVPCKVNTFHDTQHELFHIISIIDIVS